MDGGRIDLERARREAKRLGRAARAGDGNALERLGAHDDAEPRLADAQLAVARELGEASWPRLVRRAEAEAVAREDRARALVREATDGRRDHAEALLALDPELGREGLDAALVLGEVERVAPVLARDPGAATRADGARGWAPLLYVTHSAFLGGDRTDRLLACARLLLDAGADPDASWEHPEFGALSALYGAAGVAHEPRMTALLLEAGANPDDGESVYHATETSDLTCLRLLLDRGARVEGTNALAHALDTEQPEKVRLLLERGAGREVERSLLWAIYRERSPQVLRLLVQHGADLEAWDEQNQRTPYGLAWRMGRPDLCELLAGLGARRAVEPIDELLGYAFGRDRAGALRLAREHPDRVERIRTEFSGALHQAAAEGRAATVEILLELGVPIDLPGQMGGTPLHHAAWWGHGDVVGVLLAHGADPHRRAEPGTGGTPLGWTAHGSYHSPGPIAGGGTDHLAIARRLVEAGAAIEPGMVEAARAELAEWLAERLEGPADTLGALEAPAAAGAAHPDAEAGWAAQVEWLRRLAASGAETRRVGDGFGVRTGLFSNSENGVVCSGGTVDAEIAEVIAWFEAAGAPAQWLVDEGSSLGARLVAAGARAERTAVVMGAAVADLPVGAQPPEGVAIDTADAARWREVADEAGIAPAPEVPGVIRLAAITGDTTVGITSAFAVGETLYLQHLAVRAAHRRRGIGRALTAARLRAAPQCTRAVLAPTPDSTPFHRRLGFELRPFPRDRVYYLPLRAPGA